jgi:hypothetical protein
MVAKAPGSGNPGYTLYLHIGNSRLEAGATTHETLLHVRKRPAFGRHEAHPQNHDAQSPPRALAIVSSGRKCLRAAAKSASRPELQDFSGVDHYTKDPGFGEPGLHTPLRPPLGSEDRSKIMEFCGLIGGIGNDKRDWSSNL